MPPLPMPGPNPYRSLPVLPAKVGTLCLAAALAGCASLDAWAPPTAPGTPREAILAHEGPPTRVWPETDGGSTLEYATQPFGLQCWMFRMDPQGRLVEAHDALAAPWRDRIAPGMTPEAVSRLLGRERRRVDFATSGEEVWDWNVAPQDASGRLAFNVHFKGGTVVRTSYSYTSRSRFNEGR